MKKFKEKLKEKGKLFWMLLILVISSFLLNISCKKSQKETKEFNKINLIQKDTVLSYNIYKDSIDTECKHWKIDIKLNILKFTNEFNEIKVNEWYQCFGQFPCGVKGKLIKDNKIYHYNLNSGGWIQLKYKDSVKYLGSKNKKDTIFFSSVYFCDEDWGD